MKLAVDRGDCVGMVAKGEEIVANGCPLNGFAQAFLKLDVVQVHTLFLFWKKKTCAKRKRMPLWGKTWFESMQGLSAEEGRNDINTRFFAEGKKEPFFSKGFFLRKKSFRR